MSNRIAVNTNLLPREVSLERRFITTRGALLSYLAFNSPYTDCYISLCPNNDPSDHTREVTDALFFDLDGGWKHPADGLTQALSDAREFNKMYKNVKRSIVFSGRGFHFYLFLNGMYQLHSLNLSHFDSILDELNIDNAPSNAGKIVRIVDTYNWAAHRYCVSITPEELELDLSEIKSIALSLRHKVYRTGEKPLKLEVLSCSEIKYKGTHDIDPPNSIYLPPCIMSILRTEHPSHEERWAAILYISETVRLGTPIRAFVKEKVPLIKDKVFALIEKDIKEHWEDYDEKITKDFIDYEIDHYDWSPRCEWFSRRGKCLKEKCLIRKD
jgi:hypothetical protein